MDSTQPTGPRTVPKAKQSRRWRILTWTLAGLTAATLAAIVGVVAIVWWYGREADTVDPGVLLDYRPPQVTRILARDGTVIGELHTGERRTVVPYASLPPALVDAFLAAEDADFFEHDGLDWPGIVRATVSNLTHAEIRQGASTITQQVIKNTLLRRARSVERKSQEIMLAGRVESVLSKRQIFEIYVNEVYFGEGRYGVAEAARYYFGKTLDDLDLGEMATLAALPNAPGVVTCYRRVDQLRARRDYVLGQMVEHGFVERGEAAPFLGHPIVAVDHDADPRAIGEADEFVELARLELVRRYGEDELARLGATVRTSVDLELQREARASARRELDLLEARHGYGTHARALSARARKRLEARAPERIEVGRRETVIIVDQGPTVIDERVQATLGRHRVEIELGELAALEPGALAERFAPGHAVEVRIIAAPRGGAPARASFEPGPELALALADVESGELLTLIGGREFRRGGFDRTRLARRQPGSSFKPVVYGAALRSQAYTAASALPSADADAPMRLRNALAQSDNAVALALMEALGPAPVHAFARDLGIMSTLGEQPSLALGTSELSPIELLTAYLTLARGGKGREPTAILAIEVPADLHGNPPSAIATELEARKFGVEAEIAGLLTSMLRSVIEDGTGKAAQGLERPVAGKTGTTDEARDVWFAGFTPDHVAVSWVGFDQPTSLGRNESGSSLALPIWLAAMKRASEGHRPREFVRPAGLTTSLVDRETGARACREISHWFVPGHCTPTSFLWGDRFARCTPDSWTSVTPYQRCVAPERWLEELFLPGTEPAAAANTSAGEVTPALASLEPDHAQPSFATIEVRSLSLFEAPEQLDAATRSRLRKALAALRDAGEPAWARACEQARRRGWSLPQHGTRLSFRVRVDGSGRLGHIRAIRSSGHTNLDLLAEAVLTDLLEQHPLELPSVAIEPRSKEAELELELIVGGPNHL